MKSLVKEEKIFISEQDGDIERKFKDYIASMLLELKKEVRAYLVQIRYGDEYAVHVAICYKFSDDKVDERLVLNKTENIFRNMFGINEHLDILFLGHNQEQDLRKVCCPFFTSPFYQVQNPDFYLIEDDGYKHELKISCFKRKKMLGVNSTGYLLCDISPGIIGQKYGLGDKDICQVLFVVRHVGVSLFPISTWPTYVYVVRPLIDNIEDVKYIRASDIELMFWGILYPTY